MPPAPFIVGVPRSGTTLLRLQLDAHPELAIPPETGFGELAARFDGRPVTPTVLLDAITELPTWRDLHVERDALAAAFQEHPRFDLGAGLRAYYRLYAAAHRKDRYGDKTPGHTAHMDVLARTLPEARFIHIIRDGRDVAASLRGLSFAPGDGGIAAIAAEWRDTLWRVRRAAARLPHYVEVRYERLVAEPEAVLRELCDFLELSFDAAMLQAHERAADRLAELRTARIGPDGVVRLQDGTEIVARTLQPPDPTRAGRWREALTEHDVTRFERFAGGALLQEGYVAYERPSAGTTPRVSVAARNPAMRVVLGRQSLGALGGTETYALTVARELDRLGHDVTLAAEDFGLAADVATGRGIRVARMDELPSACDALIAHDLPMAATLSERYPDARLVYVVHADGWDLQLPPVVPGVVDAVVACSDRLAARVRALPLEVPIVRLREPIDTDGSVYPKALPERPRRALILSNYLQGARRRLLLDAWGSAGVECTQAGSRTSVVVDPRVAFEAADIVVGKGRVVLEAMCAGCAVYVYDQYGGDGWVTPETYPAFEADHFAGQATVPPRRAADLATDLAAYSPEMGVWNNELVRSQHGARHHAIELVAVLRGPHLREPDRAEVVAELARLARASGRSELRIAEFWGRMSAAEAHAAQAEAHAAQAEERAAQAEDHAAQAEERAAHAEERADGVERRLGDAEYLLGTKRARAGLAVGRAADRLRWRS